MTEYFKVYDIEKKGKIMNEQCIGYLRVLCDKVFQCPITAEQAKMLFDAIDENKDGYLQLDESLVKGRSPEGLMTLDVSPLVYLGGLPDMSHLLESSARETSVLTRYRGCIR